MEDTHEHLNPPVGEYERGWVWSVSGLVGAIEDLSRREHRVSHRDIARPYGVGANDCSPHQSLVSSYHHRYRRLEKGGKMELRGSCQSKSLPSGPYDRERQDNERWPQDQ